MSQSNLHFIQGLQSRLAWNYVLQASTELVMILQPQSPEGWSHSYVTMLSAAMLYTTMLCLYAIHH